MTTDFSKPTPPSADKRWRLVDATMRRLGNHSRGLIETLHTVQETFGYLDEEALRYVAISLRVPLSRAYGVATFYHFFTLITTLSQILPSYHSLVKICADIPLSNTPGWSGSSSRDLG